MIDFCDRRSAYIVYEESGEIAQTPLPTVDSTNTDNPAIETQVRTDGPAYYNRLSDIQVPAVWKGENIYETLGLDEGVSTANAVTVVARKPPGYDERPYRPIHGGWLRKIGGADDGRLLRLRVADYANLLKSIPANKQFTEATAQDVLGWVTSQLSSDERFPQVELNSYTGFLNEEDVAGGDETDRSLDVELIKSPFNPHISFEDSSSKTFSKDNGDTLVDVLNWVTNVTNGAWFFEATGWSRVSLNVVPIGTVKSSGVYDSDNVAVRQNTSLFDTNPYNAVVVIGNKVENALTDEDGNKFDGYVVGVAKHRQLYFAADETLHPKILNTSYDSAYKAKNKAVSELRKILETDSEGEVIVDGFPLFTPPDVFEAQPVCGNYIDETINEISYEAKSVTHSIPATGRYATRINGGITAVGDEIITNKGVGTGSGDIRIAGNVLVGDQYREGYATIEPSETETGSNVGI